MKFVLIIPNKKKIVVLEQGPNRIMAVLVGMLWRYLGHCLKQDFYKPTCQDFLMLVYMGSNSLRPSNFESKLSISSEKKKKEIKNVKKNNNNKMAS